MYHTQNLNFIHVTGFGQMGHKYYFQFIYLTLSMVFESMIPDFRRMIYEEEKYFR